MQPTVFNYFHLPTVAAADVFCRKGDSGLVVLDGLFPGEKAGCLVGFDPVSELRGHLGYPKDLAILDEALRKGRQSHPQGGLAGAIAYDGQYWFGYYQEFYQVQNLLPPASLASQGLANSDSYRLSLRPELSRERFLHLVDKVHTFIRSGDIYQACLTYGLSGSFTGDAWSLYLDLKRASPAPFSAWINTGEVQLLSSSPELFLAMSGRQVTTRPIKGTRPRPAMGEEAKIRRELLASEKERAELLMITDLERNDLGKICEVGSINVPQLFAVEEFAQVFHMVSTVQGTLRQDISHPAALAACFPGGSISGAPKKRAMQILKELEGVPRGYYTGALGWIAFSGKSLFNIAIRTLELREGGARFGTGAGIVADSSPSLEWEETLAKAGGILGLCGDRAFQ